MKNKKISLSEPSFSKEEFRNIKDCVKSGWLTSGRYIESFERSISKYVGVKHAIACINATSALQVSLRLMGVKQDHEVIVPSLTFIAPINAITYNGASPIFMDSDEFYNLDEDKTIEFIENNTFFKNNYTYNSKTRKKISAIIIVHVFGNAPNLDKLSKICNKRNIKIIEDASESLGTFYKLKNNKKKHVGTKGKISCISFNGNKIITSGGGGMILTNKDYIAKKARYLISQAKDDSLNYIHNSVGYNFRMSNLHASIGVAQFKKINLILKKKIKINQFYKKIIKKMYGLEIAQTPNYAFNNNWLNILQINSKNYINDRKRIIRNFNLNKIDSRPVWKLNHLQKPYLSAQKYKISNALKLHKISICLPSSPNLTNKELERITKCLNL